MPARRGMPLSVTANALLLILSTVLGALMLAVHLINMREGWSSKLPIWVRLLVLLPPAAPLVAFYAGHRSGPLLWVLVLVTYIVIRAAG